MNIQSWDVGYYRSSQPQSEGDLFAVKRTHGITRIIALNHPNPNTEMMWCERQGIQFFNVEMCPVFPPRKKEIDTVCELLIPGTLLHCQRGCDRTGLSVCAKLMRAGWSYWDCVEYLKSNRSPKLVNADGTYPMSLWLRWWIPALKGY